MGYFYWFTDHTKQTDQLTELVRLLEQKNHVRYRPATHHRKIAIANRRASALGWRAERIDSDGKLAAPLARLMPHQSIILVMGIVWCVRLWGCLPYRPNVVNFFCVGMLWFPPLMLVGWLVLTIINHGKQNPNQYQFYRSTLIRGKDDVTQSAVEVYEAQLHHTCGDASVICLLWLATLMVCCLPSLWLCVNIALAEDPVVWWHLALTKWLGWLPSMVGFSVPDTKANYDKSTVGRCRWISLGSGQVCWLAVCSCMALCLGQSPGICAWMFARKDSLDINCRIIKNPKILATASGGCRWFNEIVKPLL